MENRLFPILQTGPACKTAICEGNFNRLLLGAIVLSTRVTLCN